MYADQKTPALSNLAVSLGQPPAPLRRARIYALSISRGPEARFPVPMMNILNAARIRCAH